MTHSNEGELANLIRTVDGIKYVKGDNEWVEFDRHVRLMNGEATAADIAAAIGPVPAQEPATPRSEK